MRTARLVAIAQRSRAAPAASTTVSTTSAVSKRLSTETASHKDADSSRLLGTRWRTAST